MSRQSKTRRHTRRARPLCKILATLGEVDRVRYVPLLSALLHLQLAGQCMLREAHMKIKLS